MAAYVIGKTSVEIKVCARFAGFHFWKDAPEEVAFLRSSHRHIFIVHVTLPVKESRAVEFFQLQKAVQEFVLANFSIKEHGIDFGSRSCEAIAEVIAKHVMSMYEVEAITVEVSEDGENSAIVQTN